MTTTAEYDHQRYRQNKEDRVGGYRTGVALADWLFRNDFPDGIQVLCHNCNYAKHRFGWCRCQEEETGCAA